VNKIRCGWHNDHGSLTGLASAMYLDSDGKEVQDTDPTSGLYVLSRGGELVRVAMPSDVLAFQIGETAQIHSGGLLQATPHAVRGSR
jgi:isopenicillin N synthase-like dioxygenase